MTASSRYAMQPIPVVSRSFSPKKRKFFPCPSPFLPIRSDDGISPLPAGNRNDMHPDLQATDRTDRIALVHHSLRDFFRDRQIRHQDVTYDIVRGIIHLVDPCVRHTRVEFSHELHPRTSRLGRHCLGRRCFFRLFLCLRRKRRRHPDQQDGQYVFPVFHIVPFFFVSLRKTGRQFCCQPVLTIFALSAFSLFYQEYETPPPKAACPFSDDPTAALTTSPSKMRPLAPIDRA